MLLTPQLLGFRRFSGFGTHKSGGAYYNLSDEFYREIVVQEQTILFFVEPTQVLSEGARHGDDIGGSFEPPRRQLLERLRGQVSVSVTKLRQQVNQLVLVVAEVFDQAEQVEKTKPDRQLQLQTIELTVEVNAEGQLGILGNGGKAGGKGGIKLTFTRKSD